VTRRPEPHRMQLDGTEVVVLSPDAFERLDALRRQVGAHSNRARALQQQLTAATATLEEIREAVEQDGCAAEPGHAGDSCIRETIMAILAAHTGPKHGWNLVPRA
jgi:hypothetical protein